MKNRIARICLTALGIGAVAGAMIITHPGPAAADAANGPSGPTAVARARVAAGRLMDSYDPKKAWFPSSWWNSAVALHTIGDYMQRTGDRRYLAQLDRTFEQDKGKFPPGELSGDRLLGNFTSRAIDDGEWWGLNWIQAYDLTGNHKYLDMAVKIAEYTNDYWGSGTCGGGVWWDAEKTYKNAITNGLFIRLTAELHNRIDGDTRWLKRSRRAWNWFLNSGMINSDGLVNDGLDDDCRNNGQTVWSYNQGLIIGGGLELWRATHDPQMLSKVRHLADAAINSDELISSGVLTESCDAPDQTCDDNGKQFKGVFLRYLMDLADTTHAQRYRSFIADQAASIWSQDRKPGARLGERWAGGGTTKHPNAFDWRTQASALSALIAAIPRHAPKRSLSATMSPAQQVVMPAHTDTSQKIDLDVSATGPASRTVRVVLAEDDQVHDGSNKSERKVDLTSYLGSDKVVHVRVGDSFPDDGWGGRVYHVSADYAQH